MAHKLKAPRRGPGSPGPSERTCVGCQSVAARSELVRLVRDHRGVVAIASPGAAGRGAYLHVGGLAGNACLERAQHSKAWARAFRAKVTKVDEASLRALTGATALG